MKFFEFLEATARIAEKLSLGYDGNMPYEERVK